MRLLKLFILCCLLILGYTTNISEVVYIDEVQAKDKIAPSFSKCSLCECSNSHTYDDFTSDNKNLKYSLYTTCTSEVGLSEKLISQNTLDNLRIRRSFELSNWLKGIIRSLSFREDGLVHGQNKIYYSSINHKVLPSCQYYVFALRRILI